MMLSAGKQLDHLMHFTGRQESCPAVQGQDKAPSTKAQVYGSELNTGFESQDYQGLIAMAQHALQIGPRLCNVN